MNDFNCTLANIDEYEFKMFVNKKQNIPVWIDVIDNCNVKYVGLALFSFKKLKEYKMIIDDNNSLIFKGVQVRVKTPTIFGGFRGYYFHLKGYRHLENYEQ